MWLYGQDTIKANCHLNKLLAIATVVSSYNDFSVWCDLTRSRDQRVMWLYMHEPIKVSFRPAKFGGHRHCSSGYIVQWFYFVTWSCKTTQSKDHVFFWVGAHQSKLSSCHDWWPLALGYWRYNDFSLSRDFTKPRDRRVMWRYYHLSKFGGHRHCGSKDIIILFSHLMLQDHVIKSTCEFKGRSLSR